MENLSRGKYSILEDFGKNPLATRLEVFSNGREGGHVERVVYIGESMEETGGKGGGVFNDEPRFSSSVEIPKPGARECYNLKLPASTTWRGIVVFRAVERET